MSGVAEEFHPGFFFGEGASADELGNGGVGPHGAAGGKIFEAVVAEAEARSFDHGKFLGRGERFKHEKILAQSGAHFGMRKGKEGLEGECAKR